MVNDDDDDYTKRTFFLYLCIAAFVSVVRKELHGSVTRRIQTGQHNCTTPVPVVRQHKNERVQSQVARDEPVRARRQNVRDERCEYIGYGETLDRLLGARDSGDD